MSGFPAIRLSNTTNFDSDRDDNPIEKAMNFSSRQIHPFQEANAANTCTDKRLIPTTMQLPLHFRLAFSA